MFFVPVLLLAIGIFMIWRPDLMWSLTESWKSEDATEPSKLYIWNTRFGGCMFLLVGILGVTVLHP